MVLGSLLVPAILFNDIALPLQLLASRLGETVLSLAGVPVLREGNVVTLAHATLEVAEACSGIRFVVSLFAVAIVYGYFTDRRTWVRAALAVVAVPAAIAVNGLRVAGTGLLAQQFGAAAAQGFFYAFSGWLMFLAAFALLAAIQRLLAAAFPDRRTQTRRPETRTDEDHGRSIVSDSGLRTPDFVWWFLRVACSLPPSRWTRARGRSRRRRAGRSRCCPRRSRDGRDAPRDPRALALAASTYASAGDLKGSEALLQLVLRVEPNDVTTDDMLARVYLAQGQLDAARERFEEIARRDPKPVVAETMIGVILQSQNQPQRAQKHFERAVRTRPERRGRRQQPRVAVRAGRRQPGRRARPRAISARSTAQPAGNQRHARVDLLSERAARPGDCAARTERGGTADQRRIPLSPRPRVPEDRPEGQGSPRVRGSAAAAAGLGCGLL